MPMVLRFHFLSVPIQNCTTDISVRLIGLPMTGLFYMVHTRNHRNGHIFQIIRHKWCFVWVQNKHEKKKNYSVISPIAPRVTLSKFRLNYNWFGCHKKWFCTKCVAKVRNANVWYTVALQCGNTAFSHGAMYFSLKKKYIVCPYICWNVKSS